MFASLPMYDHPRTHGAHDALWSGVRTHLGYGPKTLDRDIDFQAGWARNDLLLGQICSLPLQVSFRDRVTVLGTSDYGLPDIPAGYYCSLFVTRTQNADRGLAPATLGRFAYNDVMSRSGWAAPLAHVSAMGLTFHTTLRTGSHFDSMAAVAAGDADLAAIDAVTWRMFERWEPAAQQLRVIARTRAAPGQSFITAKGNDPVAIRAALKHAIATLAPDHADTLGLRGIVDLPARAFDMPLEYAPSCNRI